MVKTDPLNSIQQAASDQFARQSHRYAKGHILENVSDVEAALKHLRLPAASRVLDVAAGAGHTGLYLASLGHRVTISDIAGAMLDRCREAAATRGLSVVFNQHAAEVLPYPDASFDMVTSRVAPHHFSSPADFVKEAARVLVSGGHLLVIDCSVQDDSSEAEDWLHQVEKLRDSSHHRFLTPGSWRDLCSAAGLEVVACEMAPRKQPDLQWYFETAATSLENRQSVLALIASAPDSARRLFNLGEEEGKIVWWWPMVTLVARKP